MKKYEAPVVEVEVFSVENVMAGVSGIITDPNCTYDMGLG